MADYISLTSLEGGRFDAYLATPTTSGGGAVVVLQEIFGINAAMRHVADAFAAAGWYTIVPDLFWRQQPRVELDPASESDRARAMTLMAGLDQRRAVEDAESAAAYVRNLPESNGRVGAVGYCLGGKIAFLLSTRTTIDAAISYYGVAIQDELAAMVDVKATLLLHIADNDHLCPPEAQAAIERAAAANDKVKVQHHPAVGHAFARPNSTAYDRVAAERADHATFALLAGMTA